MDRTKVFVFNCIMTQQKCNYNPYFLTTSPLLNFTDSTKAEGPEEMNGIAHVTNGNNTNGDLDKDNKTPQSYLALTKLGMGGKDPKSSAVSPKEKPPKSESPTKNGSGGGKRKSMAEMASSTLKGFTKM